VAIAESDLPAWLGRKPPFVFGSTFGSCAARVVDQAQNCSGSGRWEIEMKLKWVCLGLALMIGLNGGPAAAQTRELVVAAWGDPYESSWRKSLIPEFETQNNVKVVWVQGFSSQTLAKLRAQKDNPQIDVAMMDDGPFRLAAAGGLVEKLDRSKLSNVKDLYDVAFEEGDFGIAFGLTGTGLFYSPKVFEKNKWAVPTSWLDLFRPEFKGKVVVHNISNTNGLNLLLALNKIAGGDETNVEPGFQKMKELAPSVLTFDRFGETPTLIQQDAVVIGTWNIDRVDNFKSSTGSDLQFVFPKEGAWGWKEDVGIVKGRPNEDLAYKWIDLILSKQQQELTADYVGLGPVSKAAQLGPETAKNVFYGTEFVTRLNIPKWDIVNKERAEWTDRWNKEIERR
jgi:putative spermidine/putrescine transport system substrate-binding protein